MLRRRRRRGLLSATAICTAVVVVASLGFAASASANTTFRGTWLCNWQIGGDYLPMAGARVELLTPYVDLDSFDIPGNWHVVQVTQTDQDGNWSFTFPSDENGDDYWVRVLTNGNGVRMHDFLIPWPFFVDSDRNQNDVPLHDYGRIVIHTYRCEVWTGLQRAYDDYVATTGGRPPYGDLDVSSHAITAGTPVTLFTDIWWPADYPVGPDPAGAGSHGTGASFGLETAFHEFGHSFRHAFDAPSPLTPRLDLARIHFFADVAYWNYAQRHTDCKKTNSGFAFNEGWASYWAGKYANGRAPACTGVGPTDMSVEGNVTAALHRLQALCGMTRAQMVQVLRSRSGQLLPTAPIHTFDQFFAAAQGLFSQSGSCLRDRIMTTVADARPELQRPRSLAELIRGERKEFSTTLRAAGRELGLARRALTQARPCPPRPCVDRLEATIRVPLASGRLAMARLLERDSVSWSRRARKTLSGPPSKALSTLVARRESSFEKASKATAKRMFATMIARARPLVRRDPSAHAKAILRFLRVSLRGVSHGDVPVGLIPAPERPTTVSLGPTPTPPVELQPPSEQPPAQQPPAQQPPTSTPLPDLVVDSITGFSHSTSPALHATVRNAGDGTATASKLLLHSRSNANNKDVDYVFDVPELAPGASVTIDAACDNAHAAYAADSATATVDSTNAITESNESNNSLSASGGDYCVYT